MATVTPSVVRGDSYGQSPPIDFARPTAMPSSSRVDPLRQPPPVILPSLLLCDFGRLAEEVRAVEAAGARALHLDVMDGNFVPNITYGMPIVEAVRRVTDLPLDVHMMVARPADFVDDFVGAGADIVTIHVEAVDDPRPVLEQVRSLGATASLALNPSTPLERIAPSLPYCDMVLVMSVEPGFGAQEFDPVALDKLRTLKAQYGDRLLLEVDGGVNAETIADCTAAGAQMLVVGSAIFRRRDATYAQSLSELNRLAAS
jgi:ribulose-phosphate 3-epimerase